MGVMPYFSQTFVILRNGFLYNHDKTFSAKHHETRRRRPTLVFHDIICPLQSFQLLVSSTKMNYFEVMFSKVPKFHIQMTIRVLDENNIKNYFNSVTFKQC